MEIKIQDKINAAIGDLGKEYQYVSKGAHVDNAINALRDALAEINKLHKLMGTAEDRLTLLNRISADHILEQTEIFKNVGSFTLCQDTVNIIKSRFRQWHTTWIAKQALEVLGEPIEEIEKL